MTLLEPSEWNYFAEGKANVLLKSLPPANADKLLRLRLKNSSTYQSTKTVYDYINTIIRPILSDFLPYMKLLELPRAFLDEISNKLLSDHSIAIDKDESFGLLIENCLPQNSTVYSTSKFAKLHVSTNRNDYVLELKPKWLYTDLQEGLYCRNCAHEKYYKKSNSKKFCTLGLLSSDTTVLKTTINDIFSSTGFTDPTAINSLEDVLFEYVFSTECDKNIFKVLALNQNKGNNRHEILKLGNERDVSLQLLLGMTLRDVTIFLRFTKIQGDDSLQCDKRSFIYNLSSGTKWALAINVVDVDSKSPQKWEYWRSREKNLVDQDAYNDVDLSWGNICLL